MIEREFKYITDWNDWYMGWSDYYSHRFYHTLSPNILSRHQVDSVLVCYSKNGLGK